jgi:hypothetical protein
MMVQIKKKGKLKRRSPPVDTHTMVVERKEDVLLQSLQSFYAQDDNLERLTRALRDEDMRVSLRNLDWLVTNYAKKENIVYSIGEKPINLFVDYKSQLKSFSKKFFDPFCRRERMSFIDAHGKTFSTTLGQLCFFRWALTSGVIEFAKMRATEIEEDMLRSVKHRPPPPGDDPSAAVTTHTKPRRRELSRAAIKTCTRTMLRVRVTFA